jgi:hypothetical protein
MPNNRWRGPEAVVSAAGAGRERAPAAPIGRFYAGRRSSVVGLGRWRRQRALCGVRSPTVTGRQRLVAMEVRACPGPMEGAQFPV